MKIQRLDGESTCVSRVRSLKPAIMIASALLSAPMAFTVSAAPEDPPSASGDSRDKGDNLEAIVVTGSRISRRDYQSDSPIVTIDQSTIEAAGQPTLDRAIGEMPQFAAAQGMSEVGDVQGATGFAGGQSYGDLRGLGPNRALVLIDGRRTMSSNPNGSIDLNTIPMSMIENVEVITGGASSTYGSDAIAGVLNFKLRNNFSGAELSVTHGETTHGDGATEHVSALLGGNFAEGRGHSVLAFEYSERGVVHGADRPFFTDIRQLARPPEGIMPAGTFGSAPTIAAVNSVLAGYPGTTPIAGTGLYNGSLGVNSDGTIFTDLAAPNCVQNYKGLGQKGVNIGAGCTRVQVGLGKFFAIQVPLTKYNVFAGTTYKLGDHVSAYTQFNFMESQARDETAGGSTGPGKELLVPLNNPFVVNNPALQTILASRTPDPANPNALTQPLVLTKLLTASGDRIQTFKYDVFQAIVGLKGDVPGPLDLSWDVYGSYGRTLFNNLQQNDSSKVAFASILNGTANYQGAAGNCVGYAWNPFGSNPLSPGCKEYATRENNNVNTMTQKNLEGTVQGKIWTLPAGELRFALGADYRGSSFDYRPDQGLITNDSFSYDTTIPTSGTQNVREVFAELLVPVLKDLPFIQELSLDLGARRSQYDLFGGVTTWKADLNWKPVSSVAVRGGYAKAIRAPSLGELFAPTVTGNLNIGAGPSAGDPCATGSVFRTGANAAQVAALCQAQGIPAALYPTYTYGVDSVHGTSGGNPQLTPETADTYSVGTVWSPHFDSALMRKFQLSVDYYHISIANAVGSLSLTDILPRCFNSDGISNPSYSAANIYCQQIARDRNTGDIVLGHEGLLNLASYKTDGIDTEIDWSFGLDALGLNNAGTFRFNSLIAYVHTFDVASLPGSPVLDFAGSIGNTQVSPEMAHPHWKANTAFGYSIGPVSAAVHWRYIAAMKHQDLVVDPTATTPGVPAYNYFDIDAHWAVIDHLELTAGVTNIADKGPPFVSGQPLTTDTATYDIIGRTYFVGFKAKF